MALITRISRLFRADIHAVLDRIEEPDVLLRQAVREMEDALARDEQRLRLLILEEQQLGTRITDGEQALRRIDEELDVCFAAGKDDLARALIRRRLETERLGELLARRRNELASTLAGLRRRVDENRTQLESMRQKATLLTAQEQEREDRDDWSTPAPVVHDADVEVAFLREKQRRRAS